MTASVVTAIALDLTGLRALLLNLLGAELVLLLGVLHLVLGSLV
jgi:hypothetical protein